MSVISEQVASKLTTLSNNLTSIRASLTSKTGTSHTSTPIGSLSGVIDGISVGGSAWTRPEEWLSMPTITDVEQKCGIVYTITDTMFHASFTCAGAYTVDWGDSVTENFSTGSNAQHTYTFADITKTLANGNKQVLITITPQSGQNLTSIDLTSAHSAYPTKSWINGLTDIYINAPSLTTLVIFSVTALRSKAFNLQSFSLNKNSMTSMSQMLSECYALRKIGVLDTSACLNFSYLFKKCYSLEEIPLLDTSKATNMSNMFNACFALRTVPALNTSLCTDFSSMFSQCSVLQDIPLLDTSKGLNMSSMFTSCLTLSRIPAINTAAATNISSMFSACAVLFEIPNLNISSATNVATMFGTCPYLQKAKLTGTPISISYLNCNLSRAAIVDIFNGLPTVTNSSVITITGNPGTSLLQASDNLIATGKGWSITT